MWRKRMLASPGKLPAMKIVVGSDDYGRCLAASVCQWLGKSQELEILPGGRPYYEVAWEAAQIVAQGQADRALLVCGSGMGMAIVANKAPGVYAAVCENVEAARKARSINNSNVLTLGEMVTSPELAQEIVKVWLDTPFATGWPSEIQGFLHNSMGRIAEIEKQSFAR